MGDRVRPTNAKVETADGVVPAAGIATVPVLATGHSVDVHVP